MRKIFFTLTILFTVLYSFQHSFAQDSSGGVQQWKVESRKMASGKYELSFSAQVKSGWQVYAPKQTLPEVKTTELKFTDSSITQSGDFMAEGDPKKINVPFFENTSVYVYETEAKWKVVIAFSGAVPARLQGTLLYSYGSGDEFYPSTVFPFVVALEGGVESAGSVKVASIDISNPVNSCGDEGTKNKSIFSIFLLGILGGLIALLTPCVFPMIPVTVTFFTKKSRDRRSGIANASLYGFFIFLIYLLITIPFHVASKTISPEIFNNISTNVVLNLIFFAVFVLFALSFFGLFEIGLPAGLANKAGAKSGIGNIAGIFFMAGTLAIVSFSCTGPILGTLLTNVAVEGAWPLTAGAGGFGLALGLPFALFAMFPNWLHSLPKSGGWMTDVKVVLGFIELALAIKFFSNADLVKQWGFLKREVFIGLWILIGLLMVLYLLGKIRIAHRSPVKRFSFTRIAFIVFFASFTLYLVPGLTNSKWADLKLISGFPPPRANYSLYSKGKAQSRVFEPLQNDYKRALELGKKENKPVLIDFTGWACINCRRMEDKVWHDPVVDSLMRNEFVVVSLYVDERRKLPVAEQTIITTSAGTEKSIITVGDKWATFQTENFGATSQPQYAIISPDEKALTKTKFYTPNPVKFAGWLKCGLDAFGKNTQQSINNQ